MGLLDAFNDDGFRMGLGLLAAGGARADGAGFGQRMAEGLQYADQWQQQKAQAKRAQMQEQMYAMQMEEAKRKQEQEVQMQSLIKQFARPGQAGLAPLMGDESTGIMPSAGKPAVAPSFDYKGYAGAMASIDPMKALALNQALQKEGQINKLDVKDFDPASVAKFSQTGNYGDLVRLDKAHFANTGGETVAMNPFTGQPLNKVANSQSPDSRASNAVQWANHGLSRERLNFDKAGGADANKPKLVDGQWVTAPTGMAPGEVRQAIAPTSIKDAKDVLALIDMAEKVLPNATGSYIGAGMDQAARAFGKSTGGDTAAAQLKALEGALIAKMPKMSGPQSDKDAALYRQSVGDLGDPTVPNSRKQAALNVVRDIQTRYAGGTSGPIATPTAVPTMRWNPKTKSLEMVK